MDVEAMTSTLARIAADVTGTAIAPDQPLMEARLTLCFRPFSLAVTSRRSGNPALIDPWAMSGQRGNNTVCGICAACSLCSGISGARTVCSSACCCANQKCQTAGMRCSTLPSVRWLPL